MGGIGLIRLVLLIKLVLLDNQFDLLPDLGSKVIYQVNITFPESVSLIIWKVEAVCFHSMIFDVVFSDEALMDQINVDLCSDIVN